MSAPDAKNAASLPTSAITGAASFSDNVGMVFAAALILVCVTLLVEWPYLTLEHAQDDWHHLDQAVMVYEGANSLAAFLNTPHNEHWIPAWKLWYYWNWRIGGVHAPPWHASIVLCHAVSAYCVFRLGRRYFTTTAGSFSAALTWAAIANFGWDGPLSWIAASHLCFGLTWLLAAMVCVSHAGSTRWPWWALAMSVCVCAAICFMGVMAILTPVLVAQYVWLERERPMRWQRDAAWLAACLVPALVLGSWQLKVILPLLIDRSNQQHAFDVMDLGYRIAAQLARSVHQLFGFPSEGPPSRNDWIQAGVGVILAIMAVISNRKRRAYVLLIWSIALVYLVMCHGGRLDKPAELTLGWARYNYIPALAWSIALGAFVDYLAAAAGATVRVPIAVGLAVVLTLYVWHQRELSEMSAQDFRETAARINGPIGLDRELLFELDEMGRRDQRVVKMPNLYLGELRFLFPAQRFAHLYNPRGMPYLRVEHARRYTAADNERLIELLSRSKNRRAPQWKKQLRPTLDAMALALALSERAQETGHAVRVPNFAVKIQSMWVPFWLFVDQFVGGPLKNVEIVPIEQLTSEEIEQTLEWLRHSSEPAAPIWIEAIEEQLAEKATIQQESAATP